MTSFARDAQDHACISGVRLDELLTQAGVATPAYVYDLDGIRKAASALKMAFGEHDHLIAYAVKANAAGSIVRTIAACGAGACLVSGAELLVAEGVGIAPTQMVMNGVAKSDWELDLAISKGLFGIQVESLEELERVAARARAQKRQARVGLRINPGVEIDSHSHIATGHDAAKFGIPRDQMALAFERAAANPDELGCVGVSVHVGSMLTRVESYLESASIVCDVAKEGLQSGHALEYLDFGGGFGIQYDEQPTESATRFAHAAIDLRERMGLSALKLVVEPGRSMVGPHGVLVARVVQHKEGKARRWLMIDAGMNDLLRPALYGARHRIEPLEHAPGALEWRVVGPICESSDDFGSHALGDPPKHVVIRDAGAYGFAMASEYNGRALASEVFVDSGKVTRVSRSPGYQAWVERRLDA